jgi:5-methylcytosine-specific restriction endonuclease McrA
MHKGHRRRKAVDPHHRRGRRRKRLGRIAIERGQQPGEVVSEFLRSPRITVSVRISFMACKKGRVKLNLDQDRRLFIDSAGTCLLCQTPLFPTSPRGRSISVAERAHIVAHSPAGPRGRGTEGGPAVDDPANLVLLCPTCHTKVDKVPAEYPAEMLLEFKATRAAAVARVGSVITYDDRAEARSAVEEILRQNRETFNQYGPNSDDGSLPTPEAASKWRELVLMEIVPRNELLYSIVQVNEHLASAADRLAAEHLRAHTRDLAAKHQGGPLLAQSQKFPKAAEEIFSGSVVP